MKVAGTRKVLIQVKPAYPPLARKGNLTGIVKLVATVAPEGSVVRTSVIGGNPVLVQAAIDAVSKSRWQVAPEETKETIEIKFEPPSE